MLRRRQYLEKLEMYIQRDVVKIITGVRRSGKTTLIKQFVNELKLNGVPEKDILYIDFEDMAYTYINSPEDLRDILVGFLKSAEGHAYIFLDEVQTVKEWSRVASEMMNFHDCDIYVTASNLSVFGSEFARMLAYRYVRIDVLPFSFSEYLELMESGFYKSVPSDTEEEPSKNDRFIEYLRLGGMPGVYALKDPGSAADYLKDIYNTVIIRDVVQCNGLREINHIDKVMEYIMTHMGEAFSPKAIKDYVSGKGTVISVDTVYSCLDALCGAFLIYKLPRYDVKAGRELETLEKYYICDIPMRNAVMGDEGLKLKVQLEDVLAREMLGRGFRLNAAKSGQSMIDIMASRGQDRTYLNICETVTDKEAVKKAFGPLTRIRDNYFKMVLSMDPGTIINKGGIMNFPIVEFLSGG